MVTYPVDAQYLRDHALELEYIDDTAGPSTFFSRVSRPMHGDVAFKELKQLALEKIDELFVVTWFLDPELELLRDGWDRPVADPARQDIRMQPILLAAANAGVKVRGIIWDFANLSFPSATGSPPQQVGVQQDLPVEIDGVPNLIMSKVLKLREKLRAISLDNDLLVLKHPDDFFGSHHQKFWIARQGTHLTAFVGGINFNQLAWDEQVHDVLDPRRNPASMEGKEREKRLRNGDPPKYLPRHDWMVRVSGHAAHALLEEFFRRWDQSGLAPPPKALPDPRQVDRPGTMFVQISRTWPRDPEPGQILKAYVKAFERARSYIYIENQYWTSEALTNVLIKQLANFESIGLKVIIVLPAKGEDPGVDKLIAAEQNFQLGRLVNRFGRNKVLLFRLFRKHPTRPDFFNIYIHAKLAIVDDRWMTVGSANTNNRSMVLDSECNAQLAHAEFVTKVRKRIWKEMLDAPEAEDDDAALAIEQGWRKIGVGNENAKRQGEALRGLILPHRLEGGPIRRPPEQIRKYL